MELPGLGEHGGEEIVYVLSGTPDGVTFFVVRSLAPGERARIAGTSAS